MSIWTVVFIFVLIVFLGAIYYWLRPHVPREQVANFALSSARKPGDGDARQGGGL